jgi:hypothetical protein
MNRGHFPGARDNIEAPNDDAAMALDKKLLRELDIELWQGARFIARLSTERR